MQHVRPIHTLKNRLWRVTGIKHNTVILLYYLKSGLRVSGCGCS